MTRGAPGCRCTGHAGKTVVARATAPPRTNVLAFVQRRFLVGARYRIQGDRPCKTTVLASPRVFRKFRTAEVRRPTTVVPLKFVIFVVRPATIRFFFFFTSPSNIGRGFFFFRAARFSKRRCRSPCIIRRKYRLEKINKLLRGFPFSSLAGDFGPSSIYANALE